MFDNLRIWANSVSSVISLNNTQRLTLPLLCSIALTAQGATMQELEEMATSWPDAQLTLTFEADHNDDAVSVGDDIRYRLAGNQSGSCYLLHLDSFGAATLMKPDNCESATADASDFSTLFPATGSLSVSAPLGVEQVFAFLVDAQLPQAERLLADGQSFAALETQEDFDAFVNEVTSAASTLKIAMAELSYEVNASKENLQFTTRGIVRKVVAGAEKNGGNVAASFDVQSILFDVNSADLSESSKAQLDAFGAALQSAQLEGIQLRVAGHTDDVGAEAYNQNLSQQRAVTVTQYFQDNFQISDERLKAQGLGETKPLAPNDTAENRAMNRRVEMLFVTE
ncbi:MAG: outer membrane protein OmpA-like peptidoglycan-associated protein [Halioglobus sp.]|jgi:outer membrane protein OmpA-like peptidoglycan-associated protein